jgi:hypothetical protein
MHRPGSAARKYTLCPSSPEEIQRMALSSGLRFCRFGVRYEVQVSDPAVVNAVVACHGDGTGVREHHRFERLSPR